MDVLASFGRIDFDRTDACSSRREGQRDDIVEFKIGYESVVLARSVLYSGPTLSPRQVFLALAKEIPDPSDPQKLIENRYGSWNEVDSTLEYDRIEVLGPPLDSVAGSRFLTLVLEAGDAIRSCGSLCSKTSTRNATRGSAIVFATTARIVCICKVFCLARDLRRRDVSGLVAPTRDEFGATHAKALALYRSAQ